MLKRLTVASHKKEKRTDKKGFEKSIFVFEKFESTDYLISNCIFRNI